MATRCDILSGGGAHPTSDTAGSGGTHHAAVLAMTMENSGGTYPAAVTGDANVTEIPSAVVVGDVNMNVDSGGSHPAMPVLDADILSAVRALNRYPQRTTATHTLSDALRAESALAMRITRRWLDLLPSTRSALLALKQSVGQDFLEELRNFGRLPRHGT